jgi:hypothetical protein
MFDVQFNRRRQVTFVRFHGMLSPQDFVELDAIAHVLVAAEGPTDCIFDFSAVEGVDLPVDFVARRAHQRQICPGFHRIIVAPQGEIAALARLFGNVQGTIGCERPAIVPTVEAALARLGAPAMRFRAIETTWLRAAVVLEQPAFLH